MARRWLSVVPDLAESEGDVTLTPTEGRERGEKRAERGIKRAAFKHRPEIERGTLKFLDALLASPTGCATLDDATDSLREKYLDGGKWRASIPKRLKAAGLIVVEGVVKSARVARHAGYLTEWRLTDRVAAERHRAELLAALTAKNGTGPTMPVVEPVETSLTHTTTGVNEHGQAQ